MRRAKKASAAALAGLVVTSVVLSAGPAFAALDTQTRTAQVLLQSTSWSSGVSIPQFDPAIGTLQKVDITLDAHVEGDARYENLDPAAAVAVQASIAADIVVLRGMGGPALVSAHPQHDLATETLEVYDGVTDFDGPSGATWTGLADDKSATTMVASAAGGAQFIGNGSIDLPIIATGASAVTGGGSVQSQLPTNASAKVTVIYEYVPDNNPPDPPLITSSPAAFTSNDNPTVSFSSEPGATFECQLDGPLGEIDAWGSCTSPWTRDLSLEEDGAYTFSVRAIDLVSNVGAPATVSFTLDRIAPETPLITFSPGSPGNDPMPTWTFTTETGTIATCQIDSDAPVVGCAGSFQPDLTTAAEGSHTFTIYATDTAGNDSGPATRTYVLDRLAPLAPLVTSPTSPGSDTTPTWTFTAETGAALACRADGIGTFTPCLGGTFTADLTAGAQGQHYIEVHATDAVGNVGPDAVGTYTLDTIGPVAPTVVAPPSPSNGRLPVFTFTAEPGATAECWIDSQPAQTCSSGTFVADLGTALDGVHSISVQATDGSGNPGAVAVASYTLDTTKPVAPQLTVVPADPGSDATPTWSFTIEWGTSAECSIDSGAWALCPGGTYTAPLISSDGPHSFTVRTTDIAGNTSDPASDSFVLDTLLPAAPLITLGPVSPGNGSKPVWTFDSPPDGIPSCSVDGGPAIVGCASPFEADLTAAADGVHTFSVWATDAAGNDSSETTGTYLLDRINPAAPVFTVTPATPSKATNPSWSFTTESGATTQCSVDGGAPVPCSGSFVADFSAPGLDGVHTISLWATDAAGNVGPAAMSQYVLDTTAPPAPIISDGPPAASPDDTPTWTFTFEAGAIAECRLDDGAWIDCSSGTFTADLIAALDGTHAVAVRATDAVGNVGPTAATAYLLDRAAPPDPVFTSSPLSPGMDANPVWTFTIEPGATATCSFDGGPSDVCDGTFEAALASDGAYTLRVQATDAAGNTSGWATSDYELDTVAPAPPTLVGPSSPSSDVTPSWSIKVKPGDSAQCAFNSAAFVPCGASFTTNLTGQDGRHRLRVRARDAAGNLSTMVTSYYVLDTVAPAAPVFTHTPDATGWYWAFTVPADAVAECSVDGGKWTSCSSPLKAKPGDDEAHLEVRARDAAGNRSPAVGANATAIVVLPPPPVPKDPGAGPVAAVNLPDPGADRGTTSSFSAPVEAAASAPPATTAAAPELPVVDDRGRPPVAELLQVAAERTTVPLLLVLLIVGFVAIQNRIDRRDPKLVTAPARHEPEYLEFK